MSQTAPPIPGYAINRPHRADARRNFDALLSAARTAFADAGADVPLEDIARAAGVGIGTLYRNFPTRQHLFEAVYLGELEELCQAGYDAAALPPWEGFTAWLDRFAGYMVTKYALLDVLKGNSEMFRACRQAMLDAVTPLFDRAQVAGEIRADADLDDVLRMLGGVVAASYDDDGQRARVMAMTLDGIRPRG